MPNWEEEKKEVLTAYRKAEPTPPNNPTPPYYPGYNYCEECGNYWFTDYPAEICPECKNPIN